MGKKASKRYTSDLTDKQWKLLEPMIPLAKPGGRPRTVDVREVVNGILYRLRSGCSWENLPKDFPSSRTVFYYFREWGLDGTWQRIHDALRTMLRVKHGKLPEPTAGIIDSQSVKTSKRGALGDMMRARR